MRNDDFLRNLPKAPTAAEIRAWDAGSINFGVSGTTLMENAGAAITRALGDFYGDLAGRTIWLIAGKGNNGGDAARAARGLIDAGANPRLFCAAELAAYRGDAKLQIDLALKDGVAYEILPAGIDYDAYFFNLLRDNPPPCLLVDGFLGTGFNGELKAGAKNLVDALNNLGRLFPIVAIDVPSGLNADTGLPSPLAVKAAYTVTLASAKPGLLLSRAKSYVGSLCVKDIGMPRALARERRASYKILDGRALLNPPAFPDNSYKNKYGHVLVIGGTFGLRGAGKIAALASARSGAGLVTLCSPESEVEPVSAPMEIMTLAVGNDWPAEIKPELGAKINAASACVVGPGMGRGKNASEFLAAFLALENRPPTVFDADALFILAAKPNLRERLRERDALTPHPGEAARLLGAPTSEVQADRAGALAKLRALSSAAAVLKGADTLVTQEGWDFDLISPYDIPALAIGGAGDVLAGVIGALLAKGANAFAAAGEGVLRHVMAGYFLGREYPDRGGLAGDLLDFLPRVYSSLRELPREDLRAGLTPWPSRV